MAFLQPVRMGRRSYILRGLQPTEDRVVLEESRSGFEAIRGVVGTMGAIVANAQLRSSGRGGSAIADVLIDFGAGKWRKALLGAAEECSERLRQDWKVYCEAYDDGPVQGAALNCAVMFSASARCPAAAGRRTGGGIRG